jgi:dTDP-glucose 4,6-dehydratase
LDGESLRLLAALQMTNALSQDLEFILDCTRELWEELRGRRIFITGGTGFFGCWLLESLLAANDRFQLGVSATVLTRSPESFARKAPHLAAHPALQLLPGDVRTFDFPPGEFQYAIHAATETSVKQAAEAPLEMFSTIVDGTRHVLEFARESGARKFLLTSSGAVYGRQPSGITHITEDYGGAPDPVDPRSVYGEGKRTAEQLCSLNSSQFNMECKIARCFAFVGPYLPLDIHFAIGNFIRDAVAGGPVLVNGDGTPRRSYLYAADLAVWLWTILFRGVNCRPYNVGSENDLSIADLAGEVTGALNPVAPVRIARPAVPGSPPERYVPSTKRAQGELGLREHIPLAEAIRRTAAWHGYGKAHPGLAGQAHE